MKKLYSFLSFIFLTICLQAQPFLRLPGIISDNMVVQAESVVKLWGWIEPNTTVDIRTSWGESVQTKSDYSSMFIASVKTPTGSLDPQTITFTTKRKGVVLTREVKNVRVGQVWLCAGQSNMNYSAANGVEDMNEVIKHGNLNGNLALFTAPKHCSVSPQEDIYGEWSICDEKSSYWFSSVGYFFGDMLQNALNQPIGLVNVSWGGTPVELWTRSEALDAEAIESWKTLSYSKRNGWEIGHGFNGMIAPLVNMTVAGVIWYQGEANRNNPMIYSRNFTAMIEDWRMQFGQELPFFFVQIAPHESADKDFNGALVREQQEIVAKKVYNTGIVAIPDCVDDITNIHPKYKKTVGERLAAQALADVYKKEMGKVKHAAYKSMQIKGDKVVISFSNAQEGLRFAGDSVIGLEISDGANSYPAQGKINGETLVVWAKGVKNPVAVRYCFDQTIGNLTDAVGLPVLPFRTDQDTIATSSMSPTGSVSN